MVLDPFSALGLASNIIQFVDFSLKLVSETRDIKNSAKGVSSRHESFEFYAQHLSQITATIDTDSDGTTAVGSDLKALCKRCTGIATMLQDALEELQQKGQRTMWKSFVQAMKEINRGGQLVDLSKQLYKLQDLLNLYLVNSMTKKQSSIMQQLDGLVIENKRLNMERTQDLERFKREVVQALSIVQKKSSLQSSSIEKHMSRIQTQKPVSSADVDDLSNKLTELSQKLSNFTREGKLIASEQMLLRSLWFSAMRERQESVARANDKTLHWIFEGLPPDSFTGPHPNLTQWLKEGNGIYWVHGKPGSGKSTLMKYLFNHANTESILKTWASPKPLYKASYYFWCAGSKLQRSMKGLLQSLLYDVLRQCPELIRHVYPDFNGMHYQNDYEPWAFAELQEVFAILRRQQNVSARFCFFIDGLDEYDSESSEGTHRELVDSIKALAECPHIKLCVASRPWFIFRDAFGKNTSGERSDWMLALEDLNRGDIDSYVRNTFAEDPRFILLQDQDSRYQDLITEIVDKAQGVFLWVFLVVRSLQSGLDNSDRIVDLQNRLRLLPHNLKDFFRQILGTVDEVYQKQTAQLFKTMMDTPLPLSLMTLSLMDEEDLDFAMKPHASLSNHDVLNRKDIMRRRLDARCRGLVEVSAIPPAEHTIEGRHQFFNTKVDFLHRTVRDFLQNKEMEDFFERLTQGFDPHLALAKSFLAQMKVLPNSGPEYTKLLFERLAYSARRVEEDSGVCLSNILDETEVTINVGAEQYLGLLAQRGLAKYVTRRIELRPAQISSKPPLLDYALDPPVDEFSDKKIIRLTVVETLLTHGANPNQSCDESTVWGRFVKRVSEAEFGFDSESLFLATQLLLENHADPAKEVQTGWHTRNGGGRTGRASDLWGSTKLPLYMKALDIIEQCESFTEVQKEELHHLSSQQRVGLKSWPRWLRSRVFWMGAGRISK